MTLETKMAASSPTDLLETFEAYKHANDARLAELETRGQTDPLTEQRLARIDQRLDALTLKAVQPALESGDRSEPLEMSRGDASAAWQRYMRRGDESHFADLDLKSLHTGADSEGGYVAPPELDRLIESRLQASSPLRAIATVRQTSAGVFKKPVGLGATAHWVAETAARPETQAPDLSLLEFPAGELYAMPAATQTLLDDAFVDIDGWLADEVDVAFSAQESAAFITGDGANKPQGLLTYPQTPEANHSWGELGTLPGNFAMPAPVDQLIDLVHAPKAVFRPNGRFLMNRQTLAAVRKLKDSEGRYIWQPGAAGQGAQLLGYPVTESEDMPDIADGAAAIAFGDMRRGYLIVDRQGVRVLRDPYSAKPYVLFYTTKRVGGGVANFDAIKLMVFQSS